ncbi:DUF1579 domain-containing protein [Flavihumibacter sp. R14]|nr:DUF1579 domain-containing protein [Flavihumibacter soli]
MSFEKTNRRCFAILIQKMNSHVILGAFSSVILIMISSAMINPSFSQTKDSTVSVYSAGEDTYKQMIDYSRPGKFHQLLADIAGTWTFKGKHFNWVDSVTSTVALEFSGTIVRKPFANGRYFIVDVTSEGTLEMPIQDGKMKEVKFQGVEIEGYDNVKGKFIRTSIGNHLNSGIPVTEGIYDPAKRIITFDSQVEMIPGLKTKEHFQFVLQDNDHYKWEYFNEENGKFRLGTEIIFTRVKEK